MSSRNVLEQRRSVLPLKNKRKLLENAHFHSFILLLPQSGISRSPELLCEFFQSWTFESAYSEDCVTTIAKMAYEFDEQKKIGLGLIGFGIFFSFLGVLLFFDRGLLALGNILWLSGVTILLGWRSTWDVFTNRANYKGTASFLLGLFFIFVRWPIVGIILELYGCISLFGGFWPSIKMILYQIPVLGWIIQYPILLLGRLSRGSA